MRFEWFVALRYLRADRAQSMLILAAVAIGVSVIVFLSALIGGLQRSLIDRTLGSQPHVTLRAAERVPRAVPGSAPLVGSRVVHLHQVEKAPQPLTLIDQWPAALRGVGGLPGVVAVSPTLTGAAFARRGNALRPVVVRGVDADRFAMVIRLADRMVAGRLSLEGEQAVIGRELARALGVTPGASIRLSEADGRGVRVTVAGVFELGNDAVDETWVVTSLRQAQALFEVPGGVTTLELKVDDVFAAEALAAAAAERTGLEAESWMTANAELLSGLRAQESSKQLIQFFVVVAVALGIASVMVVSVVQKAREIGILRAVGTPARTVQRVFLIQGGTLAFVGSLIGSGLGLLFARLFAALVRDPDGSARFPVDVTWGLVVSSSALAVAVGLAAAALPARRAARLDPATAIRND